MDYLLVGGIKMVEMNEMRLDLKNNEEFKKAFKFIIEQIGEDSDREGLKRTPLRIAKAFEEWFGGYAIKNPEEVLNRTFPSEGYNDLCVIKNISFNSFCEHHIAPFDGVAHIGIVYNNRIAGLDKFVKLVYMYARRLQTQEVMTQQIGEAIKKVLKPKGIYVLIEAKHKCVGSRETRNESTEFITTYRDGLFIKKEDLESRFLQLVNKR